MRSSVLACWSVAGAVAVLAAGACDSGPESRSPLPVPSVVVTPSPPPPVPTPPPAPTPPAGTRVVALGEEIRDSIGAGERNYLVTTSAAGTLLVHLEWPDDSGQYLILTANGSEVAWRCSEFAPWPVEARVVVVPGQQVLITVSRGGGCWDYVSAGGGPRAVEAMDFVVRTKMAG